MPTKILFVCSQNRLRSPTAEQVFSTYPGLSVASAGTNNDANTPLSSDLVEWAEIIFVMEERHRRKLSQGFRSAITDQKIVCLNIPDRYKYMDPELIELLKTRVGKFLPGI